MTTPAGVRFRMFLRSFMIQSSWNYRTLIGTGFAFALLPAIRSIYRLRADRDAAVQRHTGLFNSHPYLVGVALGAVSELEAQRADADLIERFKTAVRSSLGSLGDSLVWAAWRPVCAMLGITLALSGLPWWVGPVVFLAVYNAGHLALRIWGFRIGFRYGRDVGQVLRRAHLAGVQQGLTRLGAFLLGAMLPLVLAHASGGPGDWPWMVAGILAVAIGLRFGNAARTPIIAAVALLLVVGIAIGLLP